MAENSFNEIQQGANQLIDNIIGKLKQLDGTLIDINKNLANFTKLGQNTPSGLETKLKQQDELMKKLNLTIIEQQKQIKKLSNVRQTSNATTSEEVINQRALRKSSDLEAQSKSKLVGAYQNLIAKQKQAKTTLQNLIVTQGKNSTETKKAQREYDKLTSKVNQANKATSNFSKTGLGSMVRGFRNLVGAFGIVGGTMMLASFVKNVFETTKKLQSLDYALKAVVETQEDFARVQSFISDITNKYGADIVTTTERYTKFLAAAKQSNVSMQDTEKIFRTVTKASGVLGLKTDELTGIYLALEQMLSKGKVTTEELRRQLGERLPGAFGIMANAMGVSVSKLDEMLKKGEILSAEALPKFAEELEKAYGIQSVEKIDTLAAAHTRMTNEWVEFIRSLDGSDGVITKVFTSLLDFSSKVIQSFKELNQGAKGLQSRIYKNIYEDATEYYEGLEKFESERIKMVKLSLETDKLSAEERKKLQEEVLLNEKRMANEARISAETRKSSSSLNISGLKTEIYQIEQNLEKYNDMNILARNIRSEYRELTKALEDKNIALSKEEAAYDAANDYLNKNTEATIKNNEAKEDGDTKKKKDYTLEDAYNLEKARRLIEMQRLKDVMDNEEKLLGIRLDANDEYLEKYKAYIDFENEYAEKKYKDRADKIKQVKLENDRDLEEQEQSHLERINSITSNWIKGHLDRYKQLGEQFEENRKQEITAYRNLLIEQGLDREDIEKKVNEMKARLYREDLIKFIEVEIRKLNILKETAKTEEERLAIQKQINQLYSELSLANMPLPTEDLDNSLEEWESFLSNFSSEFFGDIGFDFLGSILTDLEGFKKMLEETPDDKKWMVWANTIMEVAQEAFAFINQQQQARFDAQYDRLEQEKEIAIAFAGESTSAKEEIERQYEEKRKKIRREEAKANKEMAIFNTIINTAQAVIGMLANPGGPAGIALAAVVGALGAAQIAMISSQPIPQYWSGRDGGGAEFALVDEVRPEVHTDKHGNVKSFGSKSGSNIRFLDEGDKIFSSREKWFNEELGGLLNDNGIAYDKTMNIGQTMLIDNGGLQKEDFVRHIKSLENTIRSKENINITVDKRGTNVVRGNTELLNNKIKLKGRTV